jgi:hypothetical protein
VRPHLSSGGKASREPVYVGGGPRVLRAVDGRVVMPAGADEESLRDELQRRIGLEQRALDDLVASHYGVDLG